MSQAACHQRPPYTTTRVRLMCRALGARAQVQDLLSSVFSSGPLTAAEMSKFTSAGLSGLANFPSIPLVGAPALVVRGALVTLSWVSARRMARPCFRLFL